MRNPSAPARSTAADSKGMRRQAGAATGGTAGKTATPASKQPARKPRPSKAAPLLELAPGPELLEGPPRDEMIRARAYDRYERNGRVHGRDVDDWLAAEAEVCGLTIQGADGAAARTG